MRAETWNFWMMLKQKSMCSMRPKVDRQSNSAVANVYVRFSSDAVSSKYLGHLDIWNLDNLFMDTELMWLHWPRCGARCKPKYEHIHIGQHDSSAFSPHFDYQAPSQKDTRVSSYFIQTACYMVTRYSRLNKCILNWVSSHSPYLLHT
jgi:hypothetical protein